jgi:hypothetical protein
MNKDSGSALRLHYDEKGKKIVQACGVTEFGTESTDACKIHPQRLPFHKK